MTTVVRAVRHSRQTFGHRRLVRGLLATAGLLVPFATSSLAAQSCAPVAGQPAGTPPGQPADYHGYSAGEAGWGDNGGQGGTYDPVNFVMCDPVAPALVVKSTGGNGGEGGGAGLFEATTAGTGGRGGDGGNITLQLSAGGGIDNGIAGLTAISTGGNGGQGGGGYEGYSAGNGALGGNGGNVVLANAGTIITTDARSAGMYGKSVGGQAGPGGNGHSFLGLGGRGGSGGQGGNSGSIVSAYNLGTIQTSGDSSNGITLHSIGGAGGEGAETSAGFVAIGGNGGPGGDGSAVSADNSGTIRTSGHNAQGIVATSVGGGGGDGGDALAGGLVAGVAIGGYGGHGGHGGTVTLTNGGAIQTSGVSGIGMRAQSIGGGGGDGGSTHAIAAGPFFSFAMAMGASGGAGGDGEAVTVTNGSTGSAAATIITGTEISKLTLDNLTGTIAGDYAVGILAQSIGGGGGSGGNAFAYSNAVSVDTSVSLALDMGGSGGGTGSSGPVSVTNYGNIQTSGRMAGGIVAQALAHGGGQGGSSHAINSAVGELGGTIAVNLAGGGGAGANAGAVTVANNGEITTVGQLSAGILAHSVGGGGGNGGNVLDIGAAVGADSVNIGVSLGGSAGTAGDGGSASVMTGADSNVTTYGDHAQAAIAQSVGGGGGSGGSVKTYVVAAQGGQGTAANVGVSLGGKGGTGGAGGTASITNGGALVTYGAHSAGALVQSTGGGGGNGGNVYALNVSATPLTGENNSDGQALNVSVGVGGSAGSGADGGTASFTGQSGSSVTTNSLRSSGVIVQSVGGGGGVGGHSHSYSVTTAVPFSVNQAFNLAAQTFAQFAGKTTFQAPSNLNVDVNVGGSGGTGGIGDTASASLQANSLISTLDNQSHGLHVQSVGGGGGVGGAAMATGFAGVGTYDVSVNVGGNGGSGGTGGTVTVTGAGSGASQAKVTTNGDQSFGVLAQSIGGGGGEGGSTHFSMPSLIPLLSSATLAIDIGGKGGNGNTGGNVSISDLTVSTAGTGSTGVIGQSIGGGGGVGIASSVKLYLTHNMGGHDGTNGHAGTVDISGLTVTTTGKAAIGILGQSVGGGGGIGGVADSKGFQTDPVSSSTVTGSLVLGLNGAQGNGGAVTVSCASQAGGCGAITTTGDVAFGILAQSIGGGGGLFQLPNDPAANLGATMTFAPGSGTSGLVTVADSATNPFAITTSGNGAIGIVAQSHDNGGGALQVSGAGYDLSQQSTTASASANGGIAISLNGSIATSGNAAHGIYADTISSGWTQFGTDGATLLTLGSVNSAKTVISLAQGASITTSGDNSIGIFSRSASSVPGAQTVTVDGSIVSAGPSAVHLVNDGGTSTSTADTPAIDFRLGSNGSLTTTDADAIPLVIDSPGFVRVVLNGTMTSAGPQLFDIKAGTLSLTKGANSSLTGNYHFSSNPLNGSITADLSGYSYGSVVLRDYLTANVTVQEDALLHTLSSTAIAIDAHNANTAANGQAYAINGWVASNGPGAISIVNDQLGAAGNTAAPAISIDIGDYGKISTSAPDAVALNISSYDYVKVRSSGVVMAPGGTAMTIGGGSVDFEQTRGSIQGDVHLGLEYGTGPLNASFLGYVEGDIYFVGAPVWSDGSIVQSTLTLAGTQTGSVTVNGRGGYSTIVQYGTMTPSTGTAFTIDDQTTLTVNGTVTGDIVGNAIPAVATPDQWANVTIGSGFTGSVTGNILLTPNDMVLSIAGSGPQAHTINVAQIFSNTLSNAFVPQLTSLVRPGYQPLTLTTYHESISGVVLKQPLVTHFEVDETNWYGYVDNQPWVYTFAAPDIDYTRANLTGNLASIAGLANSQVDALEQGKANAIDGALEALLLHAANATDAATVANDLQNFDSTGHFSMAESTVIGAVAANDAQHSCGGSGGAAIDPIAQGECVWARVTLGRDRRHHTQTEENIAFSFGRQVAVSDRVFVGASAAYDKMRFRNGGNSSDGSRVGVGAVIKYVRGQAFGAASVLGSFGWADGTRTFVDPTEPMRQLVARSKQKSWVLAGRLRGGYLFNLGGADLTAFADVDLPLVHDLGYVEKGAGSFNLKVGSRSQMLVDVHPRLRLGKAFTRKGGAARFYGEVGRRYALNDVKTGVSFANGMDNSAEAALRYHRERAMMSYGMGTIIDLGERFEMRLSYDWLEGKDTRNERLAAKIALKF